MILPTYAAVSGITNQIELDGYMWSSTIGWISLNCKTGGLDGADADTLGDNICATSDYQVTVSQSGVVSGYAWSSNIGWIRFGGLASLLINQSLTFPTGGGTNAVDAQVSGTFPNLTFDGWARACAWTLSAADNCSNMSPRTDGWDGWISLQGTNYELRFEGDGTMLVSGDSGAVANKDGYWWGDQNVGWIGAHASMKWVSVSGALTGTSCTIARNASACNVVLGWTFSPSTITDPSVDEVSFSTTDINTGSVAGSKTIPLVTGNYVYQASYSGGLLDTLNITAACAPTDMIGATGTCQVNTANVATVQLSATKKIVRSGSTVNLNWIVSGVTDMSMCTLTGPQAPTMSAATPLIGNSLTTGPITSYSTYTLSCTNSFGSTASASVSVEVVSTVIEN